MTCTRVEFQATNMRVRLSTPLSLEMSGFHEDGFDIASDHPEAHFSAIEMFVASLGLCTASVMVAYGETTRTPTTDLLVKLDWRLGDEPYRVSSIAMDITWPALDSKRLEAARRAARQCTIHRTLEHPPSVSTTVHV